MKKSAIAAVMAALVLSATTAFAGPDGSLELFPYGVDANGNPTTANIGACEGGASPIFGGFGQKIILGVFASLNGATLAGISGAELYVSGVETLPAGWTATVIYPASTITAFTASALVAPRTSGGVTERRQNITWTDVSGPNAPTCQKGARTEVARIELQQVGQPPVNIPSNTWIRVVAGDPPGNPNFACPSLVLCNFPLFTQVCVTGGSFLVNPVGTSCSVSVTNETWGAVKGLYR